MISLPYSFDYHSNYVGVHVGSLNESVTFDEMYQQNDGLKYKHLTGKYMMNAVMYEFYSSDGIDCIKVEFLLGSRHNCIIDMILSECRVESFKRLNYYTTLEDKFGEFGTPD